MEKIIFKKKGQGMTEYILIVALIALVAVATAQIFGEKIRDKFTQLTSELAKTDAA